MVSDVLTVVSFFTLMCYKTLHYIGSVFSNRMYFLIMRKNLALIYQAS